MANTTGFVLLTLYLSSCCLADVNVTDYIFWKKSDLKTWHEFFPTRGIEEESKTISAALSAVSSISNSLANSLSRIVAFQTAELMTAQLLMNGTSAEGCVSGIADFMPKAINEEVENYKDCASDALSKLSRLRTTLSIVNSSYWTSYHRAMSGIDVCVKTYPNKDSYSRLRSCVESMNNNYFVAANSTQNAVFPSPSMKYFQTSVIGYAINAANSLAAKGVQFLKMLVNCAALSGTVDPDAYAQELNQWKGYNDTLAKQILDSQNKNYHQVYSVEILMMTYFQTQKRALEQYVIQSRGLGYYLNKAYSSLSDYYNTVTATSIDNPGDLTCIAAAKTQLDSLASASANQSLACDLAIVYNTKALIAEVYDSFWTLNSEMPSIGNVAILNCIAQGYEFAPNTLSGCFGLDWKNFDINYTDRCVNIEQNVVQLREYVNGFFAGVDLPCGGTSLRRLLLGGEVALYNLERCMYSESGTTYSVTTPMPLTTTTGSSTTEYYSTTSSSPITNTTPANTTPSSTTTTTTPTSVPPSRNSTNY